MSAYPPTSAAKALGTLAVIGGLGLGAYGTVVTMSRHFFAQPAPGQAVPSPAAGPHTRSYYREHVEERKARLKWCDDNPGIARHDNDCLAASAARL